MVLLGGAAIPNPFASFLPDNLCQVVGGPWALRIKPDKVTVSVAKHLLA
jgi:hypothetical protein